MILFILFLILIVAIALPSINQNIRSILYVRISSIIFIYAGALALNAFYIQSIGSGIGVYSGLFQVTIIQPSLNELNYNMLLLSSFFFKTKNNKNTLLSLIFTSLKEGLWSPVLPKSLSKLDNSIPITIFKTTGYICVYIALSGLASNLINTYYYYSVFTIAFLFLFYRLVISFLALKYLVQDIKDDKE